MIYLSVLKVINSYCNPLKSINIAIQEYLNRNQISSFDNDILDKSYFLDNIIKILSDLGFSSKDVDYFLKQYNHNPNKNYCKDLSIVNENNDINLIPIFLEIILLKFLDYISKKEGD